MGELIGTNFDDFINGFLSGADNPNLTFALTANLFCQRLEIQKHIGICTNILTNLVSEHPKNTAAKLSVTYGFS